MAEDVVFLVTVQAPMRGRDVFARFTLRRSRRFRKSRFQGIGRIAGGHLDVMATPRNGGAAERRTGYALTVLRNQPGGSWAMKRDANLRAVVRPA